MLTMLQYAKRQQAAQRSSYSCSCSKIVGRFCETPSTPGI
jgi:hypothetical protein